MGGGKQLKIPPGGGFGNGCKISYIFLGGQPGTPLVTPLKERDRAINVYSFLPKRVPRPIRCQELRCLSHRQTDRQTNCAPTTSRQPDFRDSFDFTQRITF